MLSFNIMIPFSSMSAFLVSLKNILQVKGMTKPAKKDVETVENIGKLGGDLESMMEDPADGDVFKALACVNCYILRAEEMVEEEKRATVQRPSIPTFSIPIEY